MNGYSNGNHIHNGYEMEDDASFLFTSESVGEGHPGEVQFKSSNSIPFWEISRQSKWRKVRRRRKLFLVKCLKTSRNKRFLIVKDRQVNLGCYQHLLNQFTIAYHSKFHRKWATKWFFCSFRPPQTQNMCFWKKKNQACREWCHE